jgi:hydroxymethylpyrimidine/phosphomethylpyrimidine kinase
LNSEDQRGTAPSFSDDQIEAMNRAFKQACAKMGLTGDTPVIELVAVRILELAYAGEFDPDKLAATVVAEFDV